jgi:hypothetical protein
VNSLGHQQSCGWRIPDFPLVSEGCLLPLSPTGIILRRHERRYLPTFYLLTTLAKLLRAGGGRTVITENLILKQQLIIHSRSSKEHPIYRHKIAPYSGFGRYSWVPCASPDRPLSSNRLPCSGFTTRRRSESIGCCIHLAAGVNLDLKDHQKKSLLPSAK